MEDRPPPMRTRLLIDGPSYIVLLVAGFCLWRMFTNGGIFWLLASIATSALAVAAQLFAFYRWKRYR